MSDETAHGTAGAPAFDALVLAGGSGRRLGGVDKPGLLVGSATLLDRVLGALAGASTVVVVGPERPVVRPVRWAREEPPGGGPLAALAAGLALVEADVVVLLAADLPFLDTATVALLVEAPGTVIVDETGRDQLLCSSFRTGGLRAALAGVTVENGRLAPVLLPLVTRRVSPVTTPERLAPWSDVDTPGDLDLARRNA